MPGESYGNPCVCVPLNGGVSPTLQPYVVSLNSLHGIITLGTLGGVTITSQGNTIYFAVDGTAGLGTVTSVQADIDPSANGNLTVTGGPVTVAGTFTLGLGGNLELIANAAIGVDQILYYTGANVFGATDLSAAARLLIDDVNFATMRTTLGLAIGTDVQAFSPDLSAFVTNASWSGGDLTLGGGLTLAGSITAFGGSSVETLTVTDSLTVTIDITAGGTITGTTLVGSGTGITGLNANNIGTGVLAVARGGTNIASYTTGDLIYASNATTLSKLADVAAGSFLRSGGVATAPVWSTTLWPNTLVTGDILYASSATQVSRLANVATGNVLLSGGVGVASAFGKVTSSHVNNTIPTMSGGINGDLTGFSNFVEFQNTTQFDDSATFLGSIADSTSGTGGSGYVLTSTGSGGVLWNDQLSISTLSLSAQLSLSGTITAAGVTGNRTINKQSGTVRFAAAATTIVITNSLALAASSRALATVCSNDTTLKSVSAVVTNGFITLNANAAATAETEVYWELRQII